MDSVNKTLYIPLYGKAYVSKRGLFLKDDTAERIWEREGFSLKRSSRSKWLAFYMGIRSAVFDGWLREKIKETRDAVILHIGCGMDSRIIRVGASEGTWYDIDFPEVIDERNRYFKNADNYKMLSADIRDASFLDEIPEKDCAIVVMEGISMYLSPEEIKSLTCALSTHFESIELLMDCYSVFAAKASRIKNPVKSVGVSRVYGIDDPREAESETLKFINELDMTPAAFIEQLKGFEKKVFKRLYAGGLSKKLYKLYEYRKIQT